MYTVGSGELWAWGPEALRAFSQVATRLAIHGNTPKSKVVAKLYGRLSLLLVRVTFDQSWSAPIPKHHNKKMIMKCLRRSFVCLCVLCVSCQLVFVSELAKQLTAL